jgi:chromosome partitioning protein
MIIAVVNSKGGVGKTTIAAHTAAWLQEQGLAVAVIDADEQASSTDWLRKAAPQIPVFQQLSSREILEGAPELARQYDAVVADGPAALCAKIAALGAVADLVVMPLQASMLDIWASYRTARVLYKLQFQAKRPGKPHALTVLNRVRSRTKLAKLGATAAKKYGFPVSPVVLEARTAYAEACARATFVWEMGKRTALASAEINKLCEVMLAQIPECEVAAMTLARRKALAVTRNVVANAARDARAVLPQGAPQPAPQPPAPTIAPAATPPTTGDAAKKRA